MDTIRSLSDSLAALAALASAKLFHLPSPMGGRTALGFDGKRLLATAYEAEEGDIVSLLAPGGHEVKAKAVGFDRALGLAVLELEEALPETAWTAAQGMPSLGSLVLAAAYPSPQGPEARLDLLRFAGGEGDEAYIQTDGPAFPGFAGGALVDPDGLLAGFIASERKGNQGWALSARRAQSLIARIAEAGFPGGAWLGVSTLPIDAPPEFVAAIGESRDSVLIVAGLEKDGPAAKAGVLVGDLLASLGGEPVPDPGALRSALMKARPGQALQILIVRAGSKLELSALPAKASEREGGPWHHGQGQGHGRGCYGGSDEGGAGGGAEPWAEMGRRWAEWAGRWGGWRGWGPRGMGRGGPHHGGHHHGGDPRGGER